MKYVERPIEVEAFQWTGKRTSKEPQWFQDAVKNGLIGVGTPHVFVDNLEGTHRAVPGDYIIKDCEGKLFSRSPEFFERAYRRL